MVYEFPSYLYCECEFGGKLYDTASYLENSTQLKLELADRITNEEWHSTLTESFVEELTRKTGNFKRFDIFCSMVQSALSKRSSFLKLDLLNYEDLNEIRKMKILNDCLPPRCPVTVSGNRRYLILSYTTEFDKIHYPIPVLFVGCPTPDVYRNTIHKLRAKLFSVQSTMGFSEQQLDSNGTCETISKISRLQSENMALRQELLWVKESLNEVKSCHQTRLGNNSCEVFDKARPMGLKKLVNNLETELYEVRSRASRQMVEYTRKIARLQSDLEVSAINQRGMRRKIDQLSEELYFLKGGSLHRKPGSSASIVHRVNNEVDQVSRANRSNVLSHRKSQEPVFTLLNSKTNIGKRRAGSASPTINRSLSRESSNISNICPIPLNKPFNSYRQRTNSLDRALSGNRRFNPTAYIQEREKKREENALRRKLAQRQSLDGSILYQRTRSSSCADNPYNSNERNISSIQVTRTSGATSPAFSSCESGLECTTRKPYPKINTKYNKIRHSSGCTHGFIRSNNCSPHPSVLRSSRSPANGYYSSSSPEPASINQNSTSKKRNNSRLLAPLNDICTSRSSSSRSIVKSPSLSERHQVYNEGDSDLSVCSGRLSRQFQPSNRSIYTKKEKTIHDTDAELDEIDHRLNVLQGFFEKYLVNS
ncbi:unnamed protein product [Schistosoma guineensis]|nr:unnamed protein product [Schistosoma guineensis]